MHESIWPYRFGMPVVDVVLYIVWVVLFGIALAWGMKIGNKLP